MTKSFLRSFTALPAYDRRSDDPAKDYGVHGVAFLFKLRCIDDGAVLVFEVFSGWMLPCVAAMYRRDNYHSKPMGASVVLHMPVTLMNSDEPSCAFLGGPCKVASGFIVGDEVFTILIEKGSISMWQKLEEIYHRWYDAGEG